MGLTSLEKGIVLFLIDRSFVADREKLEALSAFETSLDPAIDANLIAVAREMREKLTRIQHHEEAFDRLRYEFVLAHGRSAVKSLKKRFLEAKGAKDAGAITGLILPVVKLFERTINRRLLFVEGSTLKLLLSVSTDLEELRQEIEEEMKVF